MAEIERVEQWIDVLRNRIHQEEAVGKFARSRCWCGRDYTRFGDCALCLREQVRKLRRWRRKLMNEARQLSGTEE